MAIEKGELRIGNYVNTDNTGYDYIAKVVSIHENGAYVEFSDKSVGKFLYSYFNPVPIDSYWLSVFNIDQISETDHLVNYKDQRGFCISQSKVDDDSILKAGSWFTGDNWTSLKYVHELQNYYYWIGSFKNELSSVEK